MAMFAAALPVTLALLLMMATAHSKSIDQIIMDAAPKSSTLDTFHMSPNGKVMLMVDLDIQMDMEQYMELKASDQVGREKRKALRDEKYRWPQCYVYYEFKGTDFDKDDIAVIDSAIKEWEKYTCLEFKKSTTTKNRIVFGLGDGGCYSRLGMVGGAQQIGLSKGCVKKGVVIHEIGHAIGWIHEQARPDRDRYINVNFNRIPRSWHSQFDKFPSSLINTFNIPYDYRSIMHYSGNAIAPGSIVTIDPAFQEVIGQREGLSFRDIHLANDMYGCSPMRCRGVSIDCQERFGAESFLFKIGSGNCTCYCPGSDDTEPIVKCTSDMTTTTTTTTATTTASTARTSTTTAVSTTPEDPMECVDLRPDCPQMAEDDECKMDMERMSMYCKKSCNFCDKDIDNMCMDMDSTCPMLALANFCNRTGFEMIMESKCPKSCKFCTPVDPCVMQHQLGFDVIVTSGSKRILSCLGTAVLGPVLLILTWVL